MYEELIRCLREEPLNSNKAALPIMDLCIDAAAAIENLSHRLDMAQGERDAVTRHMIELEQEVWRMRAERDAAVADIVSIAKGGKTWMCPYCNHVEDKGSGIVDCDLPHGGCKMPYTRFEWRGQKKEE